MKFIKTTVNEKIINLNRFSFNMDSDCAKLFEYYEKARKGGLFEVQVIEKEETYLSSLFLFALDMRLRNSIVKMGGIANLTSNAYTRGQGAVKELLKHSLADMKKNEVPISVLYPFSVSFYRKYGWEQFDEMIEHHLNPSSINKKLPSETYEIVHEKEPNEEMMRYYNCYAARHYNMVQKEQIQWSFDLVMLFKGDVDRQVVALKKDGEMKGLFILKYLNRDDRDTVVIDSICYDNRDVLNAMMKFIATLSLQCSRLKINLPQDLDVWPFLTERPKESLVRQRSMIRVVDVMGLNGLEINMPDCEFNLKINDAFAEWNDDVFKLSVREGFLSIEKSEQADMTCDINAFSSIISGHTNFNEMIAMGKVQLLDGYTLEQDFPKTITMLGYGF